MIGTLFFKFRLVSIVKENRSVSDVSDIECRSRKKSKDEYLRIDELGNPGRKQSNHTGTQAKSTILSIVTFNLIIFLEIKAFNRN